MSREDWEAIGVAMLRKKQELEAQGIDPKTHDWGEFDDQMRAAAAKTEKILRDSGADIKVIFNNDDVKDLRKRLAELPTLDERIETMEKIRIRSSMTRKEFGEWGGFLMRERDLPEEERTAVATAFLEWAQFIEDWDRRRIPVQTKLTG